MQKVWTQTEIQTSGYFLEGTKEKDARVSQIFLHETISTCLLLRLEA